MVHRPRMQTLMTFAEALVTLEDLREKLPPPLKPELDDILDGLKAGAVRSRECGPHLTVALTESR